MHSINQFHKNLLCIFTEEETEAERGEINCRAVVSLRAESLQNPYHLHSTTL